MSCSVLGNPGIFSWRPAGDCRSREVWICRKRPCRSGKRQRPRFVRGCRKSRHSPCAKDLLPLLGVRHSRKALRLRIHRDDTGKLGVKLQYYPCAWYAYISGRTFTFYHSSMEAVSSWVHELGIRKHRGSREFEIPLSVDVLPAGKMKRSGK